MGWWNNIVRGAANAIAVELQKRLADGSDERGLQVGVAREYRRGNQPHQLKVRNGQFNDNLIGNLTGLVMERITSQMLGQGFELDFDGDGETEQERYITATLDANKQELLFQRARTQAGEAGTGYLFLMPDSAFDRAGKAYTRLQLIDPAFVTMESQPEDYEMVIRYTIRYTFIDPVDGKEKTRRRVIEPVDEGGAAWVIRDFITVAGGREQPAGETEWPYPFAPILHWQNKVSVDSAYGEPDIDTAGILLQDRFNFLNSNLSKIVRLFAHPPRFARGLGMAKSVETNPDQLLDFPVNEANSGIFQLEQLSDMAGSLAYVKSLRQLFFDTNRVVDIDSMADKLGALTNFALHVLYQDNLNLIATMRELFGDMLEELVHRLLVIAEMEPLPCKVVWPEWLPQNDAEVVAGMEADQRMQIVSKETLAGKRGYDWKKEQERMAAEREEAMQQQENVGSFLLQGFNRGGGGLDIPPRQKPGQPVDQQGRQ